MAVCLLAVITALFLGCRPLYQAWGHQHTDSTHDSPELLAMRQKWGVDDFVRDIDHIKEDLSKMIDLQKSGKITAEEGLFYFFRMHDFDDNGKLDGLELMTAFAHTTGLTTNETVDYELLAGVADNLLKFDDDLDGFLSYPEIKKNSGVSNA